METPRRAFLSRLLALPAALVPLALATTPVDTPGDPRLYDQSATHHGDGWVTVLWEDPESGAGFEVRFNPSTASMDWLKLWQQRD